MSNDERRGTAGWAGAGVALLLAAGTAARGQEAGPPLGSAQAVWASPQSAIPSNGPACGMPMTLDDLARMSRPELDRLYQQSAPAPIVDGRVKGRALLYPGTRLAGPASKVARVMWQGKVFNACESTAVNKFFGVRAVRGNLYYGESWMDGRPALILDYHETSLVYRPYRDEIREVAPGVFLGLMYARTSPTPTFKMYFALEAAR